MNQHETVQERLAEAVQRAGHDKWLSVLGQGRDAWLEAAGNRLEEFTNEYERRHGERPDPFELLGYPIKAAAFFHPATLNASPQIQVAIWRILTGSEIRSLELIHRQAETPRLRIELTSAYGELEQPYESSSPRDMRIIRHFGMMDVGTDKLILDGYYAPQE